MKTIDAAILTAVFLLLHLQWWRRVRHVCWRYDIECQDDTATR